MMLRNINKMDPPMALSIINMKLRDSYSSLEKLCDDMELDLKEVKEFFYGNGFHYVEVENQFKKI